MAINRISGNILQDDLRRGSDLAIQGNLIYFDVANDRVGIRTSTPTDDLEVDGIFRVGNVTIDSAANVNAGGVNINDLAEPVANADAATKFYVDSASANSLANLGNLTFSNTTISTNLANADIILQPTDIGIVEIDTDTGLVIPVGNTAQRPSPAVAGTVRFNTDASRAEIYDGTEWDSVAAGVTAQIITPDGSSLQYVLDRDSTSAATLVAVNGVVQLPTVAYTVSGNVITFAESPLTTDIIDIRFL
jgi:hypothetical protein